MWVSVCHVGVRLCGRDTGSAVDAQDLVKGYGRLRHASVRVSVGYDMCCGITPKLVVECRTPPTVVVGGVLEYVFGGVLLSHTLSSAVPSALEGLASGFGMGPGVSPPLWPP